MNEIEQTLCNIVSACHDGDYHDVVSILLEMDDVTKAKVRTVLTMLFHLTMMTPYELRTELRKYEGGNGPK